MNIKVVYFDLGGVVVRVHIEKFFNKLSEISGNSLQQISDKVKLIEPYYQKFELGLVSENEFYNSIHQIFDNMSFEQFCSHYVNIFELDFKVADIIEKLSPNYRLSVISNTDSLHFNYILQNYSVLKLFEKPITSYQVQIRKPDLAIYQYALESMQCKASESIFIDDRPENVVAAQKLGMNAVLFKNAEKLIQDFDSFNIIL